MFKKTKDQVRLVTDSLVTKFLWRNLSVNKIDEIKSQWI